MKRLLLLPLAVFALSACLEHNTVGRSCTDDTGCERGQSCFLDVADAGFCSRGCAQAGDTRECPLGTVCSPMGGSRQLCTLICEEGVVCAEGLECKPASATSELESCQP